MSAVILHTSDDEDEEGEEVEGEKVVLCSTLQITRV
jgi:hypothetical protein